MRRADRGPLRPGGRNHDRLQNARRAGLRHPGRGCPQGGSEPRRGVESKEIRWTGPTEVPEDGTRTLSGQFKITHGWTFDDYDRTRRLLADAILELDRLAKTPPAR